MVWVGAALVVCCVGHALLLTGGLAGIGAALGAVAGNPVHLVVATVVLAVTVTVVLAQARRRETQRPYRRGQPGGHDQAQPSMNTSDNGSTANPSTC